MSLVARASKTVFYKNLGMVALCVVFLCWFAYDGFWNWPARNDALVANQMKAMTETSPPKLDPRFGADLDKWKGWNNETADSRENMNLIAAEAARVGRVEGWKGPLDLTVQRWIVLGLGFAVLAAVWWLVRCQARRVTADEAGISPERDVTIPWDRIQVVDNTRWKSGIVEITYVDEKGEKQKAKFDDYEVERDPLIEILDLLGEKAVKAEFIEEKPAGGNDKVTS